MAMFNSYAFFFLEGSQPANITIWLIQKFTYRHDLSGATT